MRIAYFTPHWNRVSERWNQRIIWHLKKDIQLLVANDANKNMLGEIRGFSLKYPFRSESITGRIYLCVLEKINRSICRKVRENQLIRLIHKYDINIIFINYIAFAIEYRFVIDQFPDLRVVIHCHGFDVQFGANVNKSKFFVTNSENYVDGVKSFPLNTTFIANSLNTFDRLIEIGIPEHRVELKYFGVEEHKWQPRPVRQEVNILYVGRLVDFKGPDLLIRSFILACEAGLNGMLIIAGDGPLMEKCRLLRDETRFRDKIRFLGAVSSETADMLYREADIFSCHHCQGPDTNRVEAFGVTIIEAMSHGLPVLTGASGGVLETVVDGETGYLFSPGDLKSHSEKLLLLGANKSFREKLGKNGRKRMKIFFNLEQEKQRLIEILSRKQCMT